MEPNVTFLESVDSNHLLARSPFFPRFILRLVLDRLRVIQGSCTKTKFRYGGDHFVRLMS